MIHQQPNLTIQSLARELRYTPRHFRRLFKQEIGMAPKDYIQLMRVRCIQDQLETRQSVKLSDLAYELGFSDQAHLTRVFKQHTGRSPQAYVEDKKRDEHSLR